MSVMLSRIWSRNIIGSFVIVSEFFPDRHMDAASDAETLPSQYLLSYPVSLPMLIGAPLDQAKTCVHERRAGGQGRSPPEPRFWHTNQTQKTGARHCFGEVGLFLP